MSERTAPVPDDRHVREHTVLALSEAALQIARGLDLDNTLKQIVNSARQLLQAEYAALGVFGQDGKLQRFLTDGIEAARADQIEHPPIGIGLLGAVMEERSVIRLPDLTLDPRSVGFPEGHPEMKSFLGAPILADDRVLGNLYLTNKIGFAEFSEEDVTLVQTLANHAASALLNVELYQEVLDKRDVLRLRNRELTAVQAVAQAVSDYRDLERVLESTLDEILAVTGMEAGEVYLLDEGSQTLELAAFRGPGEDQFFSFPSFSIGQGFPGRVLATGQPLISYDLDKEDDFLREEIVAAGFRTFVSLPILSKSRPIGTLDLAARHRREFSDADLRLLKALAYQMGQAIDNANLYQEVSRLAVVEERARIGMDLHDGVIQSIYAVGLTLETVQIIMEQQPAKARQMLGKAIDGLNEAIRDIRNFILDLRPRKFHGDLNEGIARLVREFRANAMVEVELDIEPEMLRDLPAPVAGALFMTIQEALANVSRHARATRVSIKIKSLDGRVQLQVSDNGRGFNADEARKTVGHGIANMESRASVLEGDFRVESQPNQGTTVTVTLPSRQPSRHKLVT